MVGKLRRAEIVKVGVATDSLPMGSLILPGNEDEEEREQRVHVILLINQTDLGLGIKYHPAAASMSLVCCYLTISNSMVLEVISKANT